MGSLLGSALCPALNDIFGNDWKKDLKNIFEKIVALARKVERMPIFRHPLGDG